MNANTNPPSEPRYLPRGLIARIAISCTHPESGITGDWLFTGQSHRIAGTAVSPVFGDLAALFTWARENHWHQVGAGYDAAYAYSPPLAPANLAVFDR